MAGRGQRVLAFARLAVPPGTTAIDHDDVAQGLIFLGLQAMIDPPREEAIQAVRACRAASIRVKMITGDHAATAAAIAGQIGLADALPEGETPRVLRGRELESMSDGPCTREPVRPQPAPSPSMCSRWGSPSTCSTAARYAFPCSAWGCSATRGSGAASPP